MISHFQRNEIFMKYSVFFFFTFLSQYLENYLWMNYSPEVSSKAYLMSICCMVNEKFRENVPAWEVTDLNYFKLSYCAHLSHYKVANFLLIINNVFRTELYSVIK